MLDQTGYVTVGDSLEGSFDDLLGDLAGDLVGDLVVLYV